jgi:hypothetical protein
LHPFGHVFHLFLPFGGIDQKISPKFQKMSVHEIFLLEHLITETGM